MDSFMIFNNNKIAKGAEAIIFSGKYLDYSVIIKHRLPKKYRIPEIDNIIRMQRLRAEARITAFAWKIGGQVPTIFALDPFKNLLIMEKIDGKLLFKSLSFEDQTLKQNLFYKTGNQIGLLHQNEIIHGDLTVFNVIITPSEKTFIIDFGLAQISNEVEKKAEDLLTFRNTLKAISKDYKKLFQSFRKGYLDIYREGKNALEHMKKIESRARYIAREERYE
ncbi:KEOPS complex kinase/ATPase Bud32 [Candidatus Hodarchaeum mangrovi]